MNAVCICKVQEDLSSTGLVGPATLVLPVITCADLATWCPGRTRMRHFHTVHLQEPGLHSSRKKKWKGNLCFVIFCLIVQRSKWIIYVFTQPSFPQGLILCWQRFSHCLHSTNAGLSSSPAKPDSGLPCLSPIVWFYQMCCTMSLIKTPLSSILSPSSSSHSAVP